MKGLQYLSIPFLSHPTSYSYSVINPGIFYKTRWVIKVGVTAGWDTFRTSENQSIFVESFEWDLLF